MICPACESLGIVNQTRCIVGLVTDMAVDVSYDSAYERWHWHDPNEHYETFTCDAGHTVNLSHHKRCWCGWPEAERGPESEK